MNDKPQTISDYRDIYEAFSPAFTGSNDIVVRFSASSDDQPRITIREKGTIICVSALLAVAVFTVFSLSKGFDALSLYIAGGALLTLAVAGHAELFCNPVLLTLSGLRRPFPLWRRVTVGKPVSLLVNYYHNGLLGEEYFVRIQDAKGRNFAFPINAMYSDEYPTWTMAFFLSFWYQLPIEVIGTDTISPLTLSQLMKTTGKDERDLLCQVIFKGGEGIPGITLFEDPTNARVADTRPPAAD